MAYYSRYTHILIPLILFCIGAVFFVYIKGTSIRSDANDVQTFIGGLIDLARFAGWILRGIAKLLFSVFRVLGNGLAFLLAASRREAPPSWSARKNDNYDEEEEEDRSPKKFDEYHV